MDLHARARGQEQSPAHRGSERSRASLEPGLVDEPPPLVSSPLCLGPCRLVQPLPPPAGARPFLFASSLRLSRLPLPAPSRRGSFWVWWWQKIARKISASGTAPAVDLPSWRPPGNVEDMNSLPLPDLPYVRETQRAGDFGGKFWWENMAPRRGELQSCWGVTMKYKQRMNLPWLTSWSSGAREFPLG